MGVTMGAFEVGTVPTIGAIVDGDFVGSPGTGTGVVGISVSGSVVGGGVESVFVGDALGESVG